MGVSVRFVDERNTHVYTLVIEYDLEMGSLVKTCFERHRFIAKT